MDSAPSFVLSFQVCHTCDFRSWYFFSYTAAKAASQAHQASLAELQRQLQEASHRDSELMQLREAMERVVAEKERYKVFVKLSEELHLFFSYLHWTRLAGGSACFSFTIHSHARRWRFCIPSHHTNCNVNCSNATWSWMTNDPNLCSHYLCLFASLKQQMSLLQTIM